MPWQAGSAWRLQPCPAVDGRHSPIILAEAGHHSHGAQLFTVGLYATQPVGLAGHGAQPASTPALPAVLSLAGWAVERLGLGVLVYRGIAIGQHRRWTIRR
jgi:hypothetical protein